MKHDFLSCLIVFSLLISTGTSGCEPDDGGRSRNGSSDEDDVDGGAECSTTWCTEYCNEKGYEGTHFCDESGQCDCDLYDAGNDDLNSDGGNGGNGSGICDIDILFTIDTSGSMMDAAENLAEVAFPCFADELIKYPNLGKIRVAVTNNLYGELELGEQMVQHSSFLAMGWPQGQPHDAFDCEEMPTVDCDFSSGKDWMTGPSDDLLDEFACVGRVACQQDVIVGEPTLQAGLEALRFSDNADFLREDALLVMVYITDEEDQSSLGPSGIRDALINLKDGREEYVVVLTMGGPQVGTVVVNEVTKAKGCISPDYGGTEQTPKVISFSELFGDRGLHYDLCKDDLCGALTMAIDALEMSCNEIIVE